MQAKLKIMKQLLRRQLKDVEASQKLFYDDFLRIIKHIKTPIFGTNKCCLWDAQITNHKRYNIINFYHNKKKGNLGRLIYSNFIGVLNKNDYLYHKCINKAICINPKHTEKKTYYNKVTSLIKKKIKKLSGYKEHIRLSFDD